MENSVLAMIQNNTILMKHRSKGEAKQTRFEQDKRRKLSQYSALAPLQQSWKFIDLKEHWCLEFVYKSHRKWGFRMCHRRLVHVPYILI
jgi:hypothetical protein